MSLYVLEINVEKSTRKVCEMLFRVHLFKSENRGFWRQRRDKSCCSMFDVTRTCPLKNAIKPFPKAWLGKTKQTWDDSIQHRVYSDIAKTVLQRYDNAKLLINLDKHYLGPVVCAKKCKIPVDASEISVAISNYAQTTRTLDELDLVLSQLMQMIDAFMNQPIQLFLNLKTML